MENASKALVMAGGILIAIMILAALAYAAGQWGLIPQAVEQSKEAQQLAKFNQEYESYNKDVMYGSDVVSVLNKAISNNSVISNDTTHPNYINVVVKINQGDIGKTVTNYETTVKDGKSRTSTTGGNTTIILWNNKEYSLKVDLTTLKSLLKSTEKTDKSPAKPQPISGGGYKETYTITVPALQEFKKRYFSCTKVGYNNQGRINYLEFTEISIQDDEG